MRSLSQLLVLASASATLSVSLLMPMGCSSTPARDDDGRSLGSSDPVEAYSERRTAEAFEHIRKAEALEAQNKDDEAMLEYRAALEIKNDLFAPWNNMGHLLMKQGNYADAVSAFQIASRLQPSDPRPEYNIGLAYQRVGWAQDSLTHFELALERQSTYLPALRGVVRSAEMVGQADQQILDYIRNAQLRETDEQWKTYFQRQRVRVESQLSLVDD